ncbi:MAG TPA: GNAT family N-acetyltransferase [Candidatus Limnocylindrales bacterium]|nr:GNAT family N-acetyltransferase [Candidatus Limnocylindrales bacterium]
MIRYRAVDDATLRTLERHEIRAHAIPGREVRDLGHAVMLHDARDADPFWNRLQSVRWPTDEAGFEKRLAEALALFLAFGRQPHIWPSPVHSGPADLVERLAANGFRDIGGGHLMVLQDPSAAAPVRPAEPGRGVTLHAIRTPADAGDRDPDDMGLVLAESFGALPERGWELALDLRRTLDDPRVVLALVRVDGEAAACAKATTFDGITYLSSIGTRDAFRGRGLAGLATRHVMAAAGAREAGRTYLGVFSGNAPALRLYTRLGFASVGESPDMLLG